MCVLRCRYCAVFGTGILANSLIRPFFESTDTSPAVLFLLELIPPFCLHRGLLDLRNGVIFDSPGLKWADLSDEGVALDEVFSCVTMGQVS